MEDVFSLKQEAFGNTTIPFTIYRAPAAIKHLHRIIQHRSGNIEDYLAVAEKDGGIVGYYQATEHRGLFFLSYIAVRSDVQGQGVGAALLLDFERRGTARGYEGFGLDAVADNVTVQQWYAKHGYVASAASHHVRLVIPALSGASVSLHWDERAWDVALVDEMEWGFSRLSVTLQAGQIELGLIGQSACKLLGHSAVSLTTAVEAIFFALAGRRVELILSGLPTAPQEWPSLQHLMTTRFVKMQNDHN